MNVQRGKLAFLLTAVVATRVLFAIVIWWRNGSSGFIEKDSGGYISLAQSLLRGSFGASAPELLRTPGYPLFLTLAAALRHVVFLGVLENILLAAACAGMIWFIATEFIGDSRAAGWAVLLYCFEPIGALYSVQILSETLFCFLMLLFVWFLLGYFRSPHFSNLLKAMAALAAATYVRPVSLYLALWLVPILFFIPSGVSLRRRGLMAVLFPVFFALMLSPWVFRNAREAGYAGFSSSGDVNLYYNSATAVKAKVEHKAFLQTRYELGFGRYFDVHPEQRNWTQGQVVRWWRDESTRIISAHLSTYLVIHARGCAVVLFDTGATVIASLLGLYPKTGGFLLAHIIDNGVWSGVRWFIREYPLASCLFLLLEVALIASYVLGIAGLRRLPREMSVLFLALSFYFVLVSGMPGAAARFRAPFMPLLCMAAGTALATRTNARTTGQDARAILDGSRRRDDIRNVRPR